MRGSKEEEGPMRVRRPNEKRRRYKMRKARLNWHHSHPIMGCLFFFLLCILLLVTSIVAQHDPSYEKVKERKHRLLLSQSALHPSDTRAHRQLDYLEARRLNQGHPYSRRRDYLRTLRNNYINSVCF